MTFDIINIGFWDDFHLLYKVSEGIYFVVLNMHDLQVCYSLSFVFGFCFQSETKPFAVRLEQTRDPALVNLSLISTIPHLLFFLLNHFTSPSKSSCDQQQSHL